MLGLNSLLSQTLLFCIAHATITGLPDQSSAGTATYSITPGGASLAAPVSYSFTFTVTEPTTAWQAPAFATSSPLPACTDTMCPALDGATCIDSAGVVYGVLCDTRFSGVVITNSGKKFLLERAGRKEVIEEEEGNMLEQRDNTGTFDECVGSCDTMFADQCLGVAFNSPYCMAYDTVTGTFPSKGEIAALRQ